MAQDDYYDPLEFDPVVGDAGDAVTTIAARLDAAQDTICVAEVESYDPTTQKLQATPVVNAPLAGRSMPYPPVPNMPVVFPCGGGFSITWPLGRGDIVRLDAADRSIDEWKLRGGKKIAPQDPRRHDKQDSLATPGGRPFNAPLRSVEDGALLLGTDRYANPESVEPVLRLRVKNGERIGLRRVKDGESVAEVGVGEDGRVFMERGGSKVEIGTDGAVTAQVGDTMVSLTSAGKLILGETETVVPWLGPAELLTIVDELLQALPSDALNPVTQTDLRGRLARIKS